MNGASIPVKMYLFKCRGKLLPIEFVRTQKNIVILGDFGKINQEMYDSGFLVSVNSADSADSSNFPNLMSPNRDTIREKLKSFLKNAKRSLGKEMWEEFDRGTLAFQLRDLSYLDVVPMTLTTEVIEDPPAARSEAFPAEKTNTKVWKGKRHA